MSMTRTEEADVVIIGGGVVGCAVAHAAALLFNREAGATHDPPQMAKKKRRKIVLFEANNSLLSGSSRGNSAMIHSGFDATPGSVEAQMVKRGHTLFEQFSAGCKKSSIPLPWSAMGALMLLQSDEQLKAATEEVIPKAERNSVAVKLITDVQNVLLKMEPNLNSETLKSAIHISSEWCVDPWIYPIMCLARATVLADVEVVRNTKVNGIMRNSYSNSTLVSFKSRGQAGQIRAKVVLNCSGLHSESVERLRFHVDDPKRLRLPFEVFPRLGRFVTYESPSSSSQSAGSSPLVRHMLLPLPTKKTKGKIVFPTVYGEIVVGPTAEDPNEIRRPQSEISNLLHKEAIKRVPALEEVKHKYVFAGKRPALKDKQDYHLAVEGSDDSTSRQPYWVTIAGVRSTGLTSSIALAEWAVKAISPALGLKDSSLYNIFDDSHQPFEFSPEEVEVMNKIISSATFSEGLAGPSTHPINFMGRAARGGMVGGKSKL